MNKSDRKIVKKILDQLLENDGNTIIVYNPKKQIVIDKEDFERLYEQTKWNSWNAGESLADFWSRPEIRGKKLDDLSESDQKWDAELRKKIKVFDLLKEKYGVFV